LAILRQHDNHRVRRGGIAARQRCRQIHRRDALRRDVSLRESYAQEKERAAAAAPGNRAAYNLQKGPFIGASIKKLSGNRTA